MTITAQFPFTTEVFKPAYKVNLRRTKFGRYSPYIGVVIVVGALLPVFLKHVPQQNQIAGLLFGVVLILLNPLLIFVLCQSQMKKSKFYGETITSVFSPEGFINRAENSEEKMAWNKVRQVGFAKAGIMIFPQQGVFYFTPRSAFASESDYEAAKAMIVDAKVKVRKA